MRSYAKECLNFSHVIIILLSNFAARANPDYSNRAAVSLETYGEKPSADGKKAAMDGVASTLNELITGEGKDRTSFHVSSDHYYPVRYIEDSPSVSLLDQFDKSIISSLRQLADKENPELTVFLAGFASDGVIGTQGPAGRYQYDQIFQYLLARVGHFQRENKKKVHVQIFLYAGKSGTAIPVMQKILKKKVDGGSFFDVTLFTKSVEVRYWGEQIGFFDQISQLKTDGLPFSEWVDFVTTDVPQRLVWTNDDRLQNQFLSGVKAKGYGLSYYYMTATSEFLLKLMDDASDWNGRQRYIQEMDMSSPAFREGAANRILTAFRAGEIDEELMLKILEELLVSRRKLRSDIPGPVIQILSPFLMDLFQSKTNETIEWRILRVLGALMEKDERIRSFLTKALLESPKNSLDLPLLYYLLPQEPALEVAIRYLRSPDITEKSRDLILVTLDDPLPVFPSSELGVSLWGIVKKIADESEESYSRNTAKRLLQKPFWRSEEVAQEKEQQFSL